MGVRVRGRDGAGELHDSVWPGELVRRRGDGVVAGAGEECGSQETRACDGRGAGEGAQAQSPVAKDNSIGRLLRSTQGVGNDNFTSIRGQSREDQIM